MIKKVETQDSQGSRKHKNREGSISASKFSKTDEQEVELMEIADQLSEKHSRKYTVPQYRLWAKFIQTKQHDIATINHQTFPI